VHTVLGRGPDAALFLVEAQAYTTGVLFSAALRLRRRFDSYGPNMHMELMGSPTRTSGADDPDGRLMLGVQLSDGRRTVMTTGFLPVTQADAPADPDALSLLSTPGGGFSGDLSSDVRYWLRPLPPSGPLLLITRWLALGIEETVTELDGSTIAAAGALATALWPPVTPQDREPPPPPPPPASGWFAESV